ncbi:MAG TPA: putative Ig domain-containing protein [Bryobacteraceae bacterium]|nr:putative Ig domain-containing protein [Bryobacteraceae bacterium]
MKNRILLLAVIAICASAPEAAAQTAPPALTVTSISPTQATVGCCFVEGADFSGYWLEITITGQNFLAQQSPPAVFMRRQGAVDESHLYLEPTEVSDTLIKAVIYDTNAIPGVYDVIVESYSPPVIAVAVAPAAPPQAAAVQFTFNPPLEPPMGVNFPAYAGVPFSHQLSVAGGTAPYTWTFASTPPPGFGLALSSSGVLTGTFPAPTTVFVDVMVTDASQTTTSFGVVIHPPPVTLTSPTNLPTAYRGQPYTFPFTAAGGMPPLFWGTEGGVPGLVLNPETGVLSGTPTELGQFPIWIYVSSSFSYPEGGGGDSGQFTLSVVDRVPLVLPPAELPAATAGERYTYQFVARDGTPPYRFSGRVPSGFTVDDSGLLSGTPAAEGRLNLAVDVTDADGYSANQTFTLLVQPPLFRITTAVLSNVRIGQTYAETLVSTGGVAPIAWAVKTGALPAGLTLDPATGKVTGSPTKGGLFRMEFQATDAKKLIATRPLTILVVVPMIEIRTQSLPGGQLNQPYSATLAADGGEPPISWSVTQGSLPGGLSLDAAGSITGKPNAKGTFAFTVTATDPSGQKALHGYEIAVTNAPVNIITAALSAARTGAAYTAAMTAEGGAGTYVWSIAAGSLPPGLSLDAGTGSITGTPALPGENNITIEVKDEAGTSASRSYVLRVAPPLLAAALSATSPGAGQQGSAGVTIAKYPVKVTGQLTMTFTPDSGYSDDPAVQFANGGRTAPIEIDAGGTNFFVPVQVGTTPGVIRITAAFTAAGADVTPSPAPERTIRIDRAAPVISSVRVTRTSDGFDVTVTGFATGRDITSATFRLAASGTSTLQGSEFTVQVGSAFSTWFASEGARQFGGQFTYTQPFSVQGDSSAITSVTVTLTNSSGASQSVTATF